MPSSPPLPGWSEAREEGPAGRSWPSLAALLRDPRCQGCGPLHLVARDPFWREDALPFRLEGGGTVCRVVPEPGFAKESLAASPDERLLLVDCPDAPGWLAPQDLVASWMARNVANAALDDVLLSHPLYEYVTQADEEGRSLSPGPLVQWTPGIPTLATAAPPPFLSGDGEAPAVNRDRAAYARAVLDLLGRLVRRFAPLEVEVGVRLGEDLPRQEGDGQEE